MIYKSNWIGSLRNIKQTYELEIIKTKLMNNK